jgi:CheY-specific phosphatase CheX
MANQILGRVKRRFCERGRDFEASTPTAIAGRELGRRYPPRAGTINLAFATDTEVVAVCFEIVPPSDGRIFPEHAEPIRCEAEGEMVLF